MTDNSEAVDNIVKECKKELRGTKGDHVEIILGKRTRELLRIVG